MLEDRQTRLRFGVVLAICLCIAYASGFSLYRLRQELVAGQSIGPAEQRTFWEAWRLVEEHFFGDVPSPKTRTYGAIRRSLTLLDPYTAFVEPIPRELEQDRLRGAYGGIGVTLWRTPEGLMVMAPYPNSPAERAGLIRGDVLMAIDGKTVSGTSTESDVQVMVRGEVGTEVHLTVRRASQSAFEATIRRERIEVPSVTWRMATPETGYIHLSSFTERTDDEVAVALAHLEEAGLGALILDLRKNRGGLLNSAVAVAGRFLSPDDVVVQQASRSAQRIFRSQDQGDVTTPMVVLVDAETASAAEIVAGALQVHDRAPLMGEPTFGKGSVQEIYDLSDGSSLHVTTAIWLTPDGQRIDKRGLEPDVQISANDGMADEALSQAVSYLESE